MSGSFLCPTETVCVPILRSDDNCASPKVGTPWSPSVHGNHEDVLDGGGPGEPRYKVRAYAGPMSPQEVCKILKLLEIHACKNSSPC